MDKIAEFWSAHKGQIVKSASVVLGVIAGVVLAALVAKEPTEDGIVEPEVEAQ